MNCGGTKELLKWDENGAVESTQARVPCRFDRFSDRGTGRVHAGEGSMPCDRIPCGSVA